MKRTILVAPGGPHCGHQIGLMLTGTTLLRETAGGEQEPWQPALTPIQQELEEWYLGWIQDVVQFAGLDPIVVLELGEMTWGSKYPDHCHTTSLVEQCAMAIQVLAPWLALPNLRSMWFASATRSHEFYQQTATRTITAQLKRDHPLVKIGWARHGLATVDGVRVDYAHKRAHPGIRNWTKGNVLRLTMQSAIQDDLDMGVEPPRLFLGAHYHEIALATVWKIARKVYRCDGMILPAMFGLSDYAQDVARSPSWFCAGMGVWELIDGEVARIMPLYRKEDVRTRHTL